MAQAVAQVCVSARARGEEADLTDADLTDADLANLNLAGTKLRSAKLAGADLTGADLTGSDLANANFAGAKLRGANLAGANLEYADLNDANLADANLTRADLKEADLTGVNFTGANLTGVDLTGSNLEGANLEGANLERAYLVPIKEDLFRMLDQAAAEVPALLSAIKSGRINGGIYDGDCACLVGTIANTRGCDYKALSGLDPDPSRAAERWFLKLRPGDTPERSEVARITAGWIEEWIAAHPVHPAGGVPCGSACRNLR
jgi:Pentapeptide repeats (8 copies)